MTGFVHLMTQAGLWWLAGGIGFAVVVRRRRSS